MTCRHHEPSKMTIACDDFGPCLGMSYSRQLSCAYDPGPCPPPAICHCIGATPRNSDGFIAGLDELPRARCASEHRDATRIPRSLKKNCQ